MAIELKVGRVYRAKNPTNVIGLYNDREIKWIGMEVVQYDGPAVPNGRRYPKVTKEQFLKWASHDVTEQLPDNDWARVPGSI